MSISDRYQRQTKLPQIGNAGQLALGHAKVFIVGLGGLGSSAALDLAAAGVGHLILNDFDVVEEHNLHRQVIYQQDHVGHLKTDSAQKTIAALNQDCTVSTINYQIENNELEEIAGKVDLVLDCTDNYSSRFNINKACFVTSTPMIFGAAIKLEGQTATLLQDANAPCYACLYAQDQIADEDCAGSGVLGPVPGLIGRMQALQAILLLTDNLSREAYKMHLFDAENMNWQEIQLAKNPACKVCAAD